MAVKIPPLKRKQKSWHGLDRPKKRKTYVRIKAVMWNDLEHSHLFDGTFDSFSYGDAELTLVSAKQIIDELHEYEHAKLIGELKRIPKDALVAFEG